MCEEKRKCIHKLNKTFACDEAEISWRNYSIGEIVKGGDSPRGNIVHGGQSTGDLLVQREYCPDGIMSIAELSMGKRPRGIMSYTWGGRVLGENEGQGGEDPRIG
ncbi:hypothetical protein E2C01_045393 [Portunus trituberculatus]|uniref:Uncharacterized protein n=1 Tax=Portunus trituberculatus TaxID=210409 RepID=A0A5B7G249_PORTR|nr:hypothetical protein [Portunus trituberculatus]